MSDVKGSDQAELEENGVESEDMKLPSTKEVVSGVTGGSGREFARKVVEDKTGVDLLKGLLPDTETPKEAAQ